MILPGFVSKMLAVLRGGVSPVWIFLSIIFGFSFGLIPEWSGLHIVIMIAVLVFNFHIGLFLISVGLAKMLCFAAAPVLYYIGIWVQNYLSFLLGALASVPIIGITDFSNYSVAGAIVLGPVIGVLAGLAMARSVIAFRRMLLKLEDGSEAFRKWYSNRWISILDRILIGRRTKDVKSLFTSKTKIIRKAGIVLALLVVAVSVVVMRFIKDDAIKNYAVNTLTRANGAEVNLDNLAVSILGGSVSASGLQITDAQNPQNNQLAINKVTADASVYNLLLGRVIMENVEVSGVKFNQKRQTPGEVIQPPIKESGVFDLSDFKIDMADVSKLEGYFKDIQEFKDWMQKLRKYLPAGKEKQPREVPQKYLGYLNAHSDVPPSPKLLARRVLLDEVEIPSQLFGNSQILVTNVSDAASSAKLPVTFDMKSYNTDAAMNVIIDYSKKGRTPEVTGTFGGFDLSKIQSLLGGDACIMFNSGIASGRFNGQLTSQNVDLTIDLTIRNLQAKAQQKGVMGLGAEKTDQIMDVLKELNTVVRVIGPTIEPRIVFDTKGLTEQFKTALMDAGREKLIGEIDKQLEKQLGDKLKEKLPGELKDTLKKDALKGLGGQGKALDGIIPAFGGFGGKDEKKEESGRIAGDKSFK